MTFFSDLSPYTYTSARQLGQTLNVGWLDTGHGFNVSLPTPKFLKRLWQFCLVSVCPQRGLEECPLCGQLGVAEFKDTRIILGTAEIRVFAASGDVAFAAPNLIYHYIEQHHYRPPAEFVAAVESGLQPTSDEYKARLRRSGSPWIETELNGVAFRFVKRPDGEVVREWVVAPKE